MASVEARNVDVTAGPGHSGGALRAIILNNPVVKAMAVLLAWTALYGPVYLSLSKTAWARPENGHAPFIIAICIGLAYAILSKPDVQTNRTVGATIIGSILITGGLALFGFSRVQEVELFLTATQPVIGLGLILVFLGTAGLRKLWFVVVLSLYLIAWPGWMIDLLTFPLKMLVSEIVSNTLFLFGLPVTHNGAVIQVGVYALLVADACAGLNSLIALTSIGAVYLYATRRGGLGVICTVAALLIPIAVLANIVRVGLLVAITYYFGYDAGQGFLHEFSGLVMFVIALLLVFVVEAIAFRLFENRNNSTVPVCAIAVDEKDQRNQQNGMAEFLSGFGYFICIVMIAGSVWVANAMSNTEGRARAATTALPPNLEQALPDRFGEWSRMALSDTILPPETIMEPGEAVAYRAYRNALGRVVTLVVAYGPPASDTVRLHRPETCYVGQGFHIQKRPRGVLNAGKATVPVNRLMTRNAARYEAVSYWLRAGDRYAVSAAAHQWINLQQGFGQRADGILVRISTTGHDNAEFDLHTTFAADLIAAMDPADRALLLVTAN